MQKLALLAGASIVFAVSCAPEAQDLTIEPGTAADPSGRGIWGYFTIRPPKLKHTPGDTDAPFSERHLRSIGTGGACLVADLNRFNLPNKLLLPAGSRPPCDNNNQCQQGLDSNAGWVGYCIASSCWVRPGAGARFCTTSKADNGGKPWMIGRYDVPLDQSKIDLARVYQDLGAKGGTIKWRVHACLNGYAGGHRDNTACASEDEPVESPNRLTMDGPVATIAVQ